MTTTILQGDVRARLRELPEKSVHCVVTSPPYWGLRAYGTPPQIWGGSVGCAHKWGNVISQNKRGADAGATAQVGNTVARVCPTTVQQGQFCIHCGAWLGELGSEPTPDLFIANLVEVFREVHRVMRDDATCWVNLGDSYAGTPNGRSAAATKALGKDDRTFRDRSVSTVAGGLKPKDLCLMPARMALALQADGWYVRSQIVWAKLSPMPESVTDRPTNAVEYIYLLTKKPTYYYDADAVRVTWADDRMGASGARSLPYSVGSGRHDTLGSGVKQGLGVSPAASGRNLWNYWLLGPEPNDAEYCTSCSTYFDGPDKKRIRVVRDGDTTKRVCPNCGRDDKWLAHFAMFPTEIPRRAIKAGTSEKGVCGECGAPWRRIIDRQATGHIARADRVFATGGAITGGIGRNFPDVTRETTGWQPSCQCGAPAVPSTVLDPFSGAGTTCLVADQLGRDGIGIELNKHYAEMSRQRIRGNAPILAALTAIESTSQSVDMFSLLSAADAS